MEGLAINALLVQLYQPELLSTGPAAKVGSVKGFRFDRSARAAASGTNAAASRQRGGGMALTRPHRLW
jgi:hypothetical protein